MLTQFCDGNERNSFLTTESGMEEFKNIVASILTPTGTQSTMTISYIKDVSTMLSIVSSMREGNLYRYLEAEQKFLPLFFAFDHDHLHYARYNSFQHTYLKHLQTTNTNEFNDLCIQGLTEKQKELLDQIVLDNISNENTVNKWIMTSHMHSQLRLALKKRMKVYASSTHKELTPGNKSMHNSQVKNLMQKLEEYIVDPFSDGPVVHITTGKELDQDIVTDLLKMQKILVRSDYKEFVEQRLQESHPSLIWSVK